MLQGTASADDGEVVAPAELIAAALSAHALAAADDDDDGDDGDGGGGAARPEALSEQDLCLALDLWHRSRWEETDAAALDAADYLGADGAPVAPRAGEGSRAAAVRRARTDMLKAIWSAAREGEAHAAGRLRFFPPLRARAVASGRASRLGL
jgi:hypothetical protein